MTKRLNIVRYRSTINSVLMFDLDSNLIYAPKIELINKYSTLGLLFAYLIVNYKPLTDELENDCE